MISFNVAPLAARARARQRPSVWLACWRAGGKYRKYCQPDGLEFEPARGRLANERASWDLAPDWIDPRQLGHQSRALLLVTRGRRARQPSISGQFWAPERKWAELRRERGRANLTCRLASIRCRRRRRRRPAIRLRPASEARSHYRRARLPALSLRWARPPGHRN